MNRRCRFFYSPALNKIAGFLLALSLLVSCAVSRPLYPEKAVILTPSGAPVWNRISPCAEEAVIHLNNPPLRAWAYKINLQNPALKIQTTSVEDTKETPGTYTSAAAKKHNWDLAINGSPFYPAALSPDSPQHAAGLWVSDGKVLSNGNSKYAAALFSGKNGSGYKVEFSYPPFNLKTVSEALGGFFIILKNGIPELPYSEERNPLTLLGTNKEGSILYILIVDGRQKNWSVGLNLHEAALWLSWLGASEGINLDGGGSTTLVKRIGRKYSVVNSPVDLNIPGKQRVVPNHLGFIFHSCNQQ